MGIYSYPDTCKTIDKDGNLIDPSYDKYTHDQRVVDKELNDGISEMNNKLDTIIHLLKQILE